MRDVPQNIEFLRDVPQNTVIQLNRQADGVFTVIHPLPEEVQECRACHDRGGDVENTRGKMFCGQCHTDIGDDHP
ncbi:hypothetical protein [Desulfatibacillum aliphaticivorans]|uniref:hypothetical protein n=1 Tax=Desulfatibacillum aliphaticivorans TaxID=218208 RepID=UPI000487F206|nr:hypothetical protein [Desulfatibacillum aliphaticivorans]